MHTNGLRASLCEVGLWTRHLRTKSHASHGRATKQPCAASAGVECIVTVFLKFPFQKTIKMGSKTASDARLSTG